MTVTSLVRAVTPGEDPQLLRPLLVALEAGGQIDRAALVAGADVADGTVARVAGVRLAVRERTGPELHGRVAGEADEVLPPRQPRRERRRRMRPRERLRRRLDGAARH